MSKQIVIGNLFFLRQYRFGHCCRMHFFRWSWYHFPSSYYLYTDACKELSMQNPHRVFITLYIHIFHSLFSTINVTIIFTLLFTFTFFDTLFAASCANYLYSSLIHNTLPQRSLVLLLLCFILIHASLLLNTLPQHSFTIIYMHSHHSEYINRSSL